MQEKKIVVKIGTAAIVSDSSIDTKTIARLAYSCNELLELNKNVMMVSSGAIACGRRKLGVKYREDERLREKQRYASIGQHKLMSAYEEEFDKYGIIVNQVLLTEDALSKKKRLKEFESFYEETLSHKDIPIFNENDAIATKEITFGDNDLLAAYLTRDLKQDLLIMLTVYDGLYKNGRTIKIADSYDPKNYDNLDREVTEGRGGLKSKLEAAKIVNKAGKTCIISNACYNLCDIIYGDAPSTKFLPK